jgi:hypothetical protein
MSQLTENPVIGQDAATSPREIKQSNGPPPSPAELRIWGCPPVGLSLPIQFTSGNRLSELHFGCPFCKQEIDPQNVHGEITRPLETVAVIEAIGRCPRCKVGIPFFFRIYSDLSMASLTTSGWRFFRARPRGLARIRLALLRMLQKLLA